MKETTKTIPIEELKLGMYIERLDRSWLTTPFFRHRFVLRDEQGYLTFSNNTGSNRS